LGRKKSAICEAPVGQNGRVHDVEIRPALDSELPTVARLRWRWNAENEGTPVASAEEFERHFVAWARESASTHTCLVVVRDDVVIGMAWLAIIRRVPSARALHRKSGDVQCVYVVPEERNSGIGGKLIDTVLDFARQRGIERVTVHSGPRAIPAYSRHGFETSPRLLQAFVDGH
jgi:GNAT superfamily N-acetyltransferase